MAKKKATTMARRQAQKLRSGDASEKRARAGSKNGRAPRSITNQILRKLAKKHRPPDEYFAGDMERPW